MTAPSLAEGVSAREELATVRLHASQYGWCAFFQSTRQVTHTRTDSAQKESNCDGGKLSLGLGQHAFEPGAVVVAVLNNGFHSAPTTAFGSPSVWTGYLATGSSTSATDCIIGGVTVLPALYAPRPFV